MVQQIKLPLAMLASLIRVSVQDHFVPVPIQIPANASGKAPGDGLSTWGLASPVGDLDEVFDS